MFVEGKGEVRPSPVRIRMTTADQSVLLQAAKALCEHRQYRTGASQWQRSHCQAVVVPRVGKIEPEVRAYFVGLVGEYALSRFLSDKLGIEIRPDLNKSDGDDGIDLKLFGLSVQVKTRQGVYQTSLVRYEDESGRFVLSTAAAFVFAKYEVECPTGNAFLLGWVPRERLLECRQSPAKRGGHKNYEVPDHQLCCMNQLVANLRARRGAF